VLSNPAAGQQQLGTQASTLWLRRRGQGHKETAVPSALGRASCELPGDCGAAQLAGLPSHSLGRFGTVPSSRQPQQQRSQISLTAPHPHFSALSPSQSDEFHEHPFQEPSGFETKEFLSQLVSHAPAVRRYPHRPATTDVALASGLQFQQLLAPHESPEPPGPPALVHIRSPRRTRCAAFSPRPPSQSPSPHQHGRAWISSPAAALPSPGWSPRIPSSGPSRPRLWPRLRCTTARCASAPWSARRVQQTQRHGRGSGRGPLQGAAHCWY
jgi:hypothetical protein